MKVEDCFRIGSILKTKGLKGEMQLYVDIDGLNAIKFKSVFIDMAGKLVPYFVKSIKFPMAGTVYLNLEDVDTIEKASVLVKKNIYLLNKFKPKKKEEDFTLKDLKGFTAVDIFGSGNIYTAELSDASGNFSSPVTLGTLTSNSSGNIQGIIPLNTTSGNAYRVRVRSSSPVVNSMSNTTNLVINQTPQATASNTGPYNVGQTIALSATGGNTYQWAGSASFSSSAQSPAITNAMQANAGIYTVTVSAAGCSATATTNVVVNGADPCTQPVKYYYNKSGNPYQTLFPLTDGMVINQITEQTTVSLVPVCDTLTIGSFELNIQGPELNWNLLQNVSPYTLFDNVGNHFFGRNLLPGQYTLTATGYAQDNKGGGRTYGPVITRFTIVGNLATIIIGDRN
ncbi:MAG: hypothetical protein EOP51_31640, partial [Sphingobacteriales bacterium]